MTRTEQYLTELRGLCFDYYLGTLPAKTFKDAFSRWNKSYIDYYRKKEKAKYRRKNIKKK